MLLTWFWLVAVMMTAYVVLDGFDLGAGILHLLIAKTDQERRTVIRTIGPVWDGNEVWLLGGGGTLYFAFPLPYASGFSGFYLPLMIVLWLLILRGIGVELRMHLDSIVWRGFFDGCFAISSLLLTVFYGAALGNVIRGVPLHQDGYFFLPLWTNWRVGPEPGVLDWYTVIAGVVALVALTMHGAHYVAVKTCGALKVRARRVAAMLLPALVVVTLLSLWGTLAIRPELLINYRRFPVLFVVPVAVVTSLAAMFLYRRRGQDKGAFLSSCAYLVFMLVGAAAPVYPNLLTSTTASSPAARAGDPCKQMHRDLDRQIDGVKAQQKDARDQCADSYGESSDECRTLKDQQEQNLRTMRDDRKGRLAGCNVSTVRVLSSTPLALGNTFDFRGENRGNCVEYPYVNCQPQEYYVHPKHHHHHHHPHQPPPPPPGPGGAGKVASGDTGKPAKSGQGPSDRRPATDNSSTS